jgi:hypothetical protein
LHSSSLSPKVKVTASESGVGMSSVFMMASVFPEKTGQGDSRKSLVKSFERRGAAYRAARARYSQ